MVFFKYHIITFVFLIKLLFIKSKVEALNFYEDKVINLKNSYTFNISSKIIKEDAQMNIYIKFNNNDVTIPNKKINFIYNITDRKTVKLNFSYSDNKIAYLKKKLDIDMKYEYYFIEFTSSNNNDKNISFFLYDNQNELLIPEENKTFSKDFKLINFDQDVIMKLKWNVASKKYLRANWTSNCDNNFTFKVNEFSIKGKNNYNIIEYNNEKKPIIYFTIPKNCDEKILKLNFDINSNNIYDLKELINKTDYIYFNDLYFFMSVLNYDNNLINYFKFDKNDSESF